MISEAVCTVERGASTVAVYKPAVTEKADNHCRPGKALRDEVVSGESIIIIFSCD